MVPPETNKEEEITENGVSESEDAKTPDSEGVTGEPVIETEKAEEKTEEPTSEKKKEKTKKKKWSIRSISFSKKTKPSKDGEKNGDVKEEAVSELNALRALFGNGLPIFVFVFGAALFKSRQLRAENAIDCLNRYDQTTFYIIEHKPSYAVDRG